jgi:L-cysteine:1D-myo-inositol 2-amino-2-deoxy-alpha-D-glucopyranoside ligase
VFVHDLLKEWEGAAVRLAVLAHHYRSDWDWTDDLMAQAAQRLRVWRAAGAGDGALDPVRQALDNDLDTPAALSLIDAAAGAAGVSHAAALLGVG